MATRRSPSARTICTPKKEAAFLVQLSETCSVKKACARARIGRRTAYDWRNKNPDFAKRWDAALDVGITVLEDEVVRRGYEGVLKPVYQQGVRVGTIREYSDTLLIFHLKAHRPKKYRDNIKIDANVTGGILCIGAPTTAEVWKNKYVKAK